MINLKKVLSLFTISIITLAVHFGITRIGAYRLHTFMDIKLSAFTSIITLSIGIYLMAKKRTILGIGLVSGTLIHAILWLFFCVLLSE